MVRYSKLKNNEKIKSITFRSSNTLLETFKIHFTSNIHDNITYLHNLKAIVILQIILLMFENNINLKMLFKC